MDGMDWMDFMDDMDRMDNFRLRSGTEATRFLTPPDHRSSESGVGLYSMRIPSA